MSKLRPRLNYGNVIATIALFIALGGVAVAAGLPKRSVGAHQLKRGAVRSFAIARGAVRAGKLAPGSVVAGKLGANAVLPGNLGKGVISTEKLLDGAVIARKIKNGVVTSGKLANGAVSTSKLGSEAVTARALADGSVTTAKLSAGLLGQLQGKLDKPATLRGSFDLGTDTKIDRQAVSFPLPLGSVPTAVEANILKEGEATAACPGLKGAAQTPEAAPGQVCLYLLGSNGELGFDPESTSRFGFGLRASFAAADEGNRIFGLWAVTES